MYARRYPPPTEKITIPENYSGSQFSPRQSEGDEETSEGTPLPLTEQARALPLFSEEVLAENEKTAPQSEGKELTADNLLLLLALLLAENGIEENLDFFLLLLLLF